MFAPTVFRRVAAVSRSSKRCFATLLSDEERSTALATLSDGGGPFSWEPVQDKNAITKTFHFSDFSQAWAFMSRSALLAEKLDHHPEWFNVYNTVEVTLMTHDCGGVSELDIAMAEKMDSYSRGLLPSKMA